MDSHPPSVTRQEHVFLVRVWREIGHHCRSEWRGYVEHVPDAARRYFTSLADLNSFMIERRERDTAAELSGSGSSRQAIARTDALVAD